MHWLFRNRLRTYVKVRTLLLFHTICKTLVLIQSTPHHLFLSTTILYIVQKI